MQSCVNHSCKSVLNPISTDVDWHRKQTWRQPKPEIDFSAQAWCKLNMVNALFLVRGGRGVRQLSPRNVMGRPVNTTTITKKFFNFNQVVLNFTFFSSLVYLLCIHAGSLCQECYTLLNRFRDEKILIAACAAHANPIAYGQSMQAYLQYGERKAHRMITYRYITKHFVIWWCVSQFPTMDVATLRDFNFRSYSGRKPEVGLLITPKRKQILFQILILDFRGRSTRINHPLHTRLQLAVLLFRRHS